MFVFQNEINFQNLSLLSILLSSTILNNTEEMYILNHIRLFIKKFESEILSVTDETIYFAEKIYKLIKNCCEKILEENDKFIINLFEKILNDLEKLINFKNIVEYFKKLNFSNILSVDLRRLHLFFFKIGFNKIEILRRIKSSKLLMTYFESIIKENVI